jgi:hypothetical protein
MFDMDFNLLIQQPESQRDSQWELNFLDGILQTKVELTSDLPEGGPDGWPYLKVKTSSEEQGTEPFANLVQWCAKRGIGLAVNTHKMVPDYVFTYGMLWNFLETGRFVLPLTAGQAGQVTFGEGVIIGAPTEKYLPRYVRHVLREFLTAQGFAEPKILVATTKDFKQTDLVFSNESLNNLAAKDQKVVAQAF